MNKNRLRKLTDRFNEFVGKAQVEIVETQEINTLTIKELIDCTSKHKEATLSIGDNSVNYYGIYISTSIENTIVVPCQPYNKILSGDLAGYLQTNVIDCELKYLTTEKFADENHDVLVEIEGKLHSISAIKYRMGNYKILLENL